MSPPSLRPQKDLCACMLLMLLAYAASNLDHGPKPPSTLNTNGGKQRSCCGHPHRRTLESEGHIKGIIMACGGKCLGGFLS